MTKPAVKKKKDEEGNDVVKPSHRYAFFMLDEKKVYASVSKSVKAEDENKKEVLAISSCRDAKDEPFWLIHRIDKVTVPPPKPVDIDELNNELDSLLST